MNNLASTPSEIKRNATEGITISWRDGLVTNLRSDILRKNCPCAGCKETRGDTSHSKPLTGKKRSLTIVENTIEQELTLQEIWAVGQYALGIRWGDGHDSGIYTFTYLRDLASAT